MRTGARVSLVLTMACAASACRAFDRAQYQALLDAHGSDASAADVAGSCLTLSRVDDAGCALAVLPDPPSTLQDQPSNGRTYTLALRRMLVGAGAFGDWQSIGFDLDRRCTTPSSTLEMQSCRPQELVTDGLDGRDNAFGSVIATGLLITRSLVDTEINADLESGRLAMGLRITEWGGGDDRRVSVDWLTLVQGRPPMGSTALTWDGRDTWKIDPGLSFAMNTTTPVARTDNAFAACGYFVANFATRVPLPYWASGRLRLLSVERGNLAGAFDPATGGTTDLVGIWTRANVVDSLPWFDFCPPPIGPRNFYEDRLDAIIRSFDVSATGVDDPSVACSAASFAMRLEWRPVTIEGVAPTPFPQANTCNTDGGLPIDP